MIGRLICYFMGHKRGRRVKLINAADSIAVLSLDGADIQPGYKLMECPRCGTQWTRKAKKEKA